MSKKRLSHSPRIRRDLIVGRVKVGSLRASYVQVDPTWVTLLRDGTPATATAAIRLEPSDVVRSKTTRSTSKTMIEECERQDERRRSSYG